MSGENILVNLTAASPFGVMFVWLNQSGMIADLAGISLIIVLTTWA